MSVTSTENSVLNTLVNSYESTTQTAEAEEDSLGREAFLTMLVAQLENQDPLNPMDGTDFSAQLAQFSQLEQLMNLNESMSALAASFTDEETSDVMDFIGKQVTGNVNTMHVDDGSVSSGFYNTSEPADIMVVIADSDGNTVRTLYEGQMDSGSHLVTWDGTDSDDTAVDDGTYTYTVYADYGSGYQEVSSSVTGDVDGIAYQNDQAYLVVQGVLLDPDSVTAVSSSASDSSDAASDSPLSYLGRTVTTNLPILIVDDGVLEGEDLMFDLETVNGDATVNIYDAYGDLVDTLTVSESDLSAGENTIAWDGLSSSGYQVEDGLYSFTVTTDSGYAATPASGEVTAIKTVNGTTYLSLDGSQRLVALSSITSVQ